MEDNMEDKSNKNLVVVPVDLKRGSRKIFVVSLKLPKQP